jgi:NAD(P)H-dependent flavin oxidoreductase YrpB (nitropropane dioxygenase family)/glutathione S-transferase
MSHINSAFATQLGIEHPVLLAGMAVVSSAPLAAAVSNAGGLGVIGAGFPNPSPRRLRQMINELQNLLHDPTKFGVDLLVPQVGGSARPTNYDYTKGTLPAMIDIICESKCRLFVCAVGVPPQWMVDRLHSSGVLVMSMVGSPKHVPKSLAVGVDAICAQGYEAGGHTGEIATMVLVPKCVKLVQNHYSPLTGNPVSVVAAGGIYNGATFAAALALGADAVWVGTRFLAADEAKTTKLHRTLLLKSTTDDTLRSAVITGRPARLYRTKYLNEWATTRSEEMKELLAKGVIPLRHDMDEALRQETEWSVSENGGYSFSQSAGDIDEILPAAVIMKRMVKECVEVLAAGASRLVNTNTEQQQQHSSNSSNSTLSTLQQPPTKHHYRLWTSPGSRSSRVLWTMNELGISDNVQVITMPFPPRITHKKYLETNILGTIPYFESLIPNESHIRMTESVGICMYLAKKYSSSLIVASTEKDYSSFLNWMFHADATLTFPQTVVLRYTKQEVGVADAAATGYAKWYIARLRLLNRTLEDDREFLCSNRLTVADICIAYALFLGTGLKEPKSGRYLADFYKPKTKRWMDRMLSRQGWLKANEMERLSLEKFKNEKTERRLAGKL